MSDQGYYRYPTIHDDNIVFVAEDDLWQVSARGGVARRLTAGLGDASRPRLSPDGSQLAFSANEDGALEVYVVDSDGGVPRRLTWQGAEALVIGWTPDGRVVFSSNSGAPFRKDWRLWSVSTTGGEPRRLPWGLGMGIAYGADGRVAICRHSEDIARWKRYRGGRVGVIWVDGDGSGDFERTVDVAGNTACPMWIGERLYFVSDHEFVGNLYSCLADGSDLQRHTHHEEYFARFPSTDGRRIAYTCGADLYVHDPATGQSTRVDVDFRSPRTQLRRKFVPTERFIEDYALHPEGHSLGLTVRGKAIVLGNWEGPVLQLGALDGVRYRCLRWLSHTEVLVVADTGGEEGLEIHQADGSGSRRIEGDIGRVIEIEVAPDGGHAAFTNHRHEVGIVDLAAGDAHIVDHSPYGRCAGLTWSNDGAWLAFTRPSSRRGLTSGIRLCNVRDQTTTDVTEGRYQDWGPSFDPEGNYLYFLSSREFNPVYDGVYFDLNFTFGARPYLVTLRKDLGSPFVPDPKPVRAMPPLGAGDPAEEVTPVDIDLDGLIERVVAFPVPEGRYDAIRGIRRKVLVTSVPVVAGRPDDWAGSGAAPGRNTLHMYDFDKQEYKAQYEAVSDFRLDASGRTIVYRTGGRLRVVPAADAAWRDVIAKSRSGDADAPSRESGWIDTGRVSAAVDPRAEWTQMFRETWRLMRDHFWTEDMSGVDWPAMYERYRPLLGRIGSRSEYSDLVWEMVGELGTSHAYEMLGDYRRPPSWRVGQLAAEFAWDEAAGGYRVTVVVRGEAGDPARSSPLSGPGAGVEVGDVVVGVGGRALDRHTPVGAALVNQVAKHVQLRVRSGDDERRVTVKTLSDERPVRYRDWVVGKRTLVHEATGGRVGYVHVPDMGPEGFGEFHRDYLRECSRDGLLVDVRYNGGGHVSQLLLEKLARRVLGFGVSRWGGAYPYPAHSVVGPLVAITNEMAGSDGDIFSHAFKMLGLGPLVGMRTWGGVIGIWPRYKHADGSLTTQPEFSTWFSDVEWGVENYGTDPTAEVDIRPQDYASGADPQLARALQLMDGLLEDKPATKPSFGNRPFLWR